MNRLRLALLSLCLAGASCRSAVGPEYEKPTLDLPQEWLIHGQEEVEPQRPLPEQWWVLLEDPVLDAFVQLVLEGSPSLTESFARWQESLAARGVTAANRLPTVDLRNERRTDRISGSFGPGDGSTQDFQSLDLGLEWNPDLFGRIQRSIEAADADIEACRADLEALWQTLAAETAASYVDLRTTSTQLAIARTTLATQRETLELVRAQRVSGLIDQLSVDRAASDASETEARIPRLEAERRALARRLAVLTGRTYTELPADLRAAVEQDALIPRAPALPELGAPALLVEARPDVQNLERAMAAQSALIGVATADLYPSVTLFGSVGLSAPGLDTLFESQSLTWSWGPRLTWNVFDRRRIQGRIGVEEQRLIQARARFEQAVLEAWSEVEDLTLRYDREQQRLLSLQAATSSSQSAVELSRRQYSAGLVDLQVVLDTQRVLLNVTDQLATSQGTLTKNWISLCRAVSGRSAQPEGRE